MPCGRPPSTNVRSTVIVNWLTSSTVPPLRVTAIGSGLPVTAMTSVCELDATSMMPTLWLSKFATYAVDPTSLNARYAGTPPTGIDAVTESVVRSNRARAAPWSWLTNATLPEVATPSGPQHTDTRV